MDTFFKVLLRVTATNNDIVHLGEQPQEWGPPPGGPVSIMKRIARRTSHKLCNKELAPSAMDSPLLRGAEFQLSQPVSYTKS